MSVGASDADKAKQIRDQSEKACRTEMESVPPDVPYTVLDLVGKGSFGSVFKGIHNDTKQVVAIKSLDLDQDDEEILDIQKEIGLLSQLKAGDAPNITAFHGSYVLGHKLWIIMDFCSGGSMRTLMKAGPIDEKYIAVVVRETLTALSYLHAQDVIHRDIKAANILVNQDGRVQLCDFGVSAQLTGKNNKRNTFVGTPQWMAPEALAGGLYDSKIDIWSFGITIYEMAKQNPPLYQYHPSRVVDMIPRMPPPRLEGGNWSNALREFVALCLNETAAQRPNAEELQRSKFVKATKASSSIMRDLIMRYELWERGGGVRASMLYGPGMGSESGPGDTVSDPAWDFDTVKSRVSGVPKEFEMLSVVARQTLRGYRPPAPTIHSNVQRGPRPRGGAERLYRLFETPGEEQEPWDEPEQDTQFQGNGNFIRAMPLENNDTGSSFGMISIPSFDDNGMRLPETIARSPSPIGMISMPTEEEIMEMAHQRVASAAAVAAAAALPPVPSSISGPISDKPTITRTRPYRADSAGVSVLQPVEIDSPLSPQNTTRSTSPRRPMVVASAPSSPPRILGQQTGGLNGYKSHHLASKSVPTFAGRDDPVPPMPSINNPPIAHSADSPGPHLKSRSQDITIRQQRPGGKPLAQRPSHLNFGPSNNHNFDIGERMMRLPTSPGRIIAPSHVQKQVLPAIQNSANSMTLPHPLATPAELGSLEFPHMAPLDATILSLSSGNEEMARELDRVLNGLGDALEVVEVGLRRLHRARRHNMPADVEE